MKFKIVTVIILIGFILISSTDDVFAQKKRKRGLGKYSQAISVDPFDYLFMEKLDVAYEMRVKPKTSFRLMGSLYLPSSIWTGVGVTASYRWFFQIMHDRKRAIEGFSVGPEVGVEFWSYDEGIDVTKEEWGGLQITVGASASYKFVIGRHLMVEPNFRLKFAPIEEPNLIHDYLISGGISMGYIW